ncbi:MAG TPA: type II CAAX endopeptidase family protein [Acidimicrobiales bacterium]
MSSSSVASLENRPRVGAILLACFIGFLAGQILAVLLLEIGTLVTNYSGGLNALEKAANPPWWSNAFGLLGLWVGFAAAIIYARREGHLRALPNQWRPRPSDLIYVVLGVLCQFGVDLLYAPFHVKSLNRPVNHLFYSAHGPTFALLATMTAFGAPFFEEWFFRGVIFRSVTEGATDLSSRTSLALGVFVSAVLFGLAHGELVQFAGLALLGIVLALLVHRTKRLVPSFLTHASFNSTALVALMLHRAGH